MKNLDVLTTRLFPKNMGSEAYVLTGIAARCDWVVLTDKNVPCTHLHKSVPTPHPKHIFLSMREPFLAIRYFSEHVLPTLSRPFVLITGSEDITIPRQTDQRWRAFDTAERGLIRHLLNHPLLVRWFAENLDDDSHPRLSPLPLGMVFPQGHPKEGITVGTVPPLAQRPLRVLCGHRVRKGPQWELRKTVSELAKTCWSEWCTHLDEDVSEKTYMDLVESHAFVICAEGGGLDPSPKAWQVILHGAVPIMRRTTTSAAYAPLPVAYVSDWAPEALTQKMLQDWHTSFSPVQDTPAQREAIVDKLGIDFWWDKISAAVASGNAPSRQ